MGQNIPITYLPKPIHLQRFNDTMPILKPQSHPTTIKPPISHSQVYTVKFLADTAIYMHIRSSDTSQCNDIITINVTTESHRLDTFINEFWKRSSHDVTELAKNGFFSLSPINTYIQCFSCGIIITKFLSNIPIFLFHWLASSNCKHLHFDNDTKSPVAQYHTKTTTAMTPQSPMWDIPFKPYIDFLMKESGFTRLSTFHTPVYICSSCNKLIEVWITPIAPWNFLNQHFRHCSYLKNLNFPSVIFTSLKQYTPSTSLRQHYIDFFRQEFQCLTPAIISAALTYFLHQNTFLDRRPIFKKYSEIFYHVLQCYVDTTMETLSSQTR